MSLKEPLDTVDTELQEKRLDPTRIPTHVAIIMDGNGRWAQQRSLPRTAGHREGVEAVRRITEHAVRLGIKYLTLYTFSTENWNRPTDEIAALMSLVLESLEDTIFVKNNVRFRCIGDLNRLPDEVRMRLLATEERTASFTKATLIIALSYSSRWEITQAAQRIAKNCINQQLNPSDITEDTITENLCTSFMPDPDLLIRTGGERRISNYLLWQCAYSEFYFTPLYWPDFDNTALEQAILSYQQRQRRFGKTQEQIQP